MYTRGSASLNNCGFYSTKNLLNFVRWAKDMLMCGCGIGSDIAYTGTVRNPRFDTNSRVTFVVEDSREGWVDSTYRLVNSYIPDEDYNIQDLPLFDYSKIRKKGEPLKGFGGTSSGSEPLQKLHKRINAYFQCYLDSNKKKYRSLDTIDMDSDMSYYTIGDAKPHVIKMVKTLQENDMKYVLEQLEKVKEPKTYGKTRLIVDIFNAIGACVVAGNIRRSSEIFLGSADDVEFKNLKNYKLNPERSSIGWMSNNTVKLVKPSDFGQLTDICKRITDNGEPGIVNMINVERCGRVGRSGDPNGREGEPDMAIGLNPCGEIPLESGELCNIYEVFLPRCNSKEEFLEACEYATIYCSIVSLYQTHQPKTNEIIARNRRIGVGIGGIS
jgi:ribonucleoside-diphosphate reductase alpha chain